MIENNINSSGYKNEEKEDMVSVMELVSLFLRHWGWIVLGIVLALGGRLSTCATQHPSTR